MPVSLSTEGARKVSWSWISSLRGWGSPIITLLGKFEHVYSSPFNRSTLWRLRGMVIWVPCHSCGFACQQKVLKTFLDPGYLRCIHIHAYTYLKFNFASFMSQTGCDIFSFGVGRLQATQYELVYGKKTSTEVYQVTFFDTWK